MPRRSGRLTVLLACAATAAALGGAGPTATAAIVQPAGPPTAAQPVTSGEPTLPRFAGTTRTIAHRPARRAAGRTLVLRLIGTPLGALAKVRLRGANGYRAVVRLDSTPRAMHVPVGTYRVSVGRATSTDPAVRRLLPAGSTYTMSRRRVHVGARRGAEVSLWLVAVVGDRHSDVTVMLAGDSHAMSWRRGLTRYAADRGFRLVIVTRSACPWADVEPITIATGKRLDCAHKLRQPIVAAAREYHPDLALLINYAIAKRDLVTPAGTVVRAGSAPWTRLTRHGVRRFIGSLRRLVSGVVIVEPTPETASSMLVCLRTGRAPAACDQPQHDGFTIPIVERLERAEAARRSRVVSVSLDEMICPHWMCPALVNGTPTHRDTHHLTDRYAASLVPQLDQVLLRAGVDLVAGRLQD